MTLAVLRAENLSCERNDRLLFNKLDFEITKGSLVHLVGPNGAGKTTLLKILAGLFRSYTGQVLWQGQSILSDTQDYHTNVLYIGHKPAIKLSLSPFENLQFLCSLESNQPKDKLIKALQAVGLSGYEHVASAHLSAGQLRRVALARLYLSNANIWLLDEAFTAIDIESTKALEKFLVAKAGEGKTILLTSHHELSVPEVHRLTLQEGLDV